MDRQSTHRIRFQTETGSIYVLTRSDEGMCWHRESATLASGPLRSDSGVLLWWPEVIEVGERCELWCEPINPPLPRIVWTSEIVAFLGEPADAAPA